MSKQVYVLSKKSLSRLEGVHPNLVKVVQRAIQLTDQDFSVLEGVRSKEQCYINYGKGRTVEQCAVKNVPAKYAQPKEKKVTWLNNPLSSKHVTGQAVDLVPYPVDWDDLAKFNAIAKAMFTAAQELDVKIRWGADWNSNGVYREKGEYDSPHFELA
ncbi:M15 family metallopeptidase [Acinetobacter ursingii]|uniref:M15 family metallopeptidase n=1 Tax=Acinetobacter ursingii TaxID=108980 RepID=UPI003AF92E4F